ncbi:MAG: ABC transporter ATP-binding protein [Chloroflexota bacterium]|nr:ABC transporter ATP-binding protein [Chloroflexota bacterium]
MAGVTLNEVVKTYGDVVAVDHVTLEVQDGEFVALVGPSGCGKTTTLNLIAGLIELTSGEILLGDRQINTLDPKDRDLAMVFQNYALYPNKTVFENLAFPLRMRKTPKASIDEQVKRTANVLSIEHLLDRHPRQLSGGQQQRVALGRALVRSPKAFLMDEPLSNLDAKLRVQMRAELKRFHQELKATVIYVTHDQMEAVTMADRIAVMHLGKLQQFASPDEIYRNPVNTFVATFIGSPAMNMLTGRVVADGEQVAVVSDAGWRMPLPAHLGRRALASSGQVIVGARHRNVLLSLEPRPDWIQGRVYTTEPTGDITYVHLMIGGYLVVASADPDFRADPDAPIWISFEPEHMHLFDAHTELLLRDGAAPAPMRLSPQAVQVAAV